jgi:hypothetical protein
VDHVDHLFTRFDYSETFGEDDEQDSDSQEVPTICSASRTIHSTCTLVVFTTFLPGIRFNDKNSGKTKLMLIPAPKRRRPMSAHLVELNDIFLHLSTVSIDSDPLAAATSFSLELKTQIPFSVLTANTQTAHSAFWSNYFRRGSSAPHFVSRQ